MNNNINNEFENLFCEKSLDEMQKIKNYEIGFKLFKTFFWVMLVGSLLMFTAGAGTENRTVTAIGIGTLVLCTVFYLIYEAKVSAAGVMNQKYAKYMLTKTQLIVCAFGAFSAMLMIGNGLLGIEFAIVWTDLASLSIGSYICARRNKKILEKMLKDESEEE